MPVDKGMDYIGGFHKRSIRRIKSAAFFGALIAPAGFCVLAF
jgi:hypothetical protein